MLSARSRSWSSPQDVREEERRGGRTPITVPANPALERTCHCSEMKHESIAVQFHIIETLQAPVEAADSVEPCAEWSIAIVRSGCANKSKREGRRERGSAGLALRRRAEERMVRFEQDFREPGKW